MAQDLLVYAELVSAQQIAGGVNPQPNATGVALTSNGTINASTRIAKVLPGSAVTGVIIQSGQFDGQELTILNVAQATGSSITFTTAGTAAASSHAARDVVVSGLSHSKWIWDNQGTLWYPVNNAT